MCSLTAHDCRPILTICECILLSAYVGIESKYAKVLHEVVPPEVLHLGPVDGDFRKVTLKSLRKVTAGK